MKTLICAFIAVIISSVQAFAQENFQLQTKADTLGYYVGLNRATQLQQGPIPFNPYVVGGGILDVLRKNALHLSEDEITKAFTQLQKYIKVNGATLAKQKKNMSDARRYPQAQEPDKIKLGTWLDTVAYSIGTDIGGDLLEEGLDISNEAVYAGFIDMSLGKPSLLTEDDLLALTIQMQKLQIDRAEAESQKNAEAGAKYQSDYRKDPSTISIASGIMYKVLKEGASDGQSPKFGNTVTMHCRGEFVDETIFFDTYTKGEPITLLINERMMPGWTEVLQLMKPGDKWHIVIPPELAFGHNGDGKVIKPDMTLIFDIELLAVE